MPAQPAKPNPDENESSRRTIEVLVLDDDVVDIEMVSRCLRQMDGWNVLVTGSTTVEESLELIEDHQFDLLFLDYVLYGDGGLAALTELRAAGLKAPTILMTGMRGEAVLVEALHAGVADYLPKSTLAAGPVQRATRNAIEKADLGRAIEVNQAALAETVKRLELRQSEIESFYHNVSHELKTPLTGVREFVSLVIDGAVGDISAEQKELLGVALRNCDQMVTCINDMLDASRLDTGKLAITRTTCDLRSVIDDAVRSLSAPAAQRNVTIDIAAPSDAVLVSLDRQRIYQVITNLLGNALKFSEPGTSVRIELDAEHPDSVQVAVIDHGRGLEPGSEDLVFDRLYQSRTEDAATLGGLGMGLYICQHLVELHDGTISVQSSPGAGCTFTFQLPRRTDAPIRVGAA